MEKTPTILVTDDDLWQQKLIEVTLSGMGYRIITASDGEKALSLVMQHMPDVILLDIQMPQKNGFEVLSEVKQNEATRGIQVVMVTGSEESEARAQALELGADDFLMKPVDRVLLKARIQSSVKLKAYYDHIKTYQQHLETEVERKTRQLREAFDQLKESSLETIYRLARAAEFKDEDTGEHILRMSHSSEVLAEGLGLDIKQRDMILYASPMHDVGKIGIPDRILLKPGQLDTEEWEIMKKHTTIGSRILEGSSSEIVQLADVIALSHHEKWNGSGYPNGLKGKEIPLPGRIVAVADVFDALLSERPYKKAFTVDKALAILMEGRGVHFDPDVLDVFFSRLDRILEIQRAEFAARNKKKPLKT
ncbi:MAG: HD domain-containing phosphohydrolase [Pseudomonadota bacterium]